MYRITFYNFIRTIFFAGLSAVFYTLEIGIHLWFNHLDVAHTIMAISMYFFYRGTLFLDPTRPRKLLDKPLSFSETGSAILGLR